MYATSAMAITTRTMMVTAFDFPEPLDAPCSTITFLRTNSSSSFGGTDMLHLASKRHAARRPGEDRDGQAAQRRRVQERRAQTVALADRAHRERAHADAGVERPHHRAERARAPRRIGV